MKAALLEDVEKMGVRGVADPLAAPGQAVIRVAAIGVCGTSLHLFRGQGNYNLDPSGQAIPLSVQPQLLGHEFSGEIVEVGRGVDDLKPGDTVLCDQGLNCYSQGRGSLCEYYASGDSQQCSFTANMGASAVLISENSLGRVVMPLSTKTLDEYEFPIEKA